MVNQQYSHTFNFCGNTSADFSALVEANNPYYKSVCPNFVDSVRNTSVKSIDSVRRS